MVDPIGILLELGFDLDDISTDEGYLSALKEAIATIELKTGGAGDERSAALREEVKKVRDKRKNKVKDFVSPKRKKSKSRGEVGYTPKAFPVSSVIPKDIEEKESEESEKKARTKKDTDFMSFLTNIVAPSLTRIEASLENIISVMSQEESQKKKTKDRARVAGDKERKQEREEKNENFVTKALGGVGQRVMAPVKSIFDKIMDFLVNIGIGVLAVQALKIIQDPAGYFGPILNPFIDFLNGTIRFVWGIINPIYGLMNIINLGIRGIETVVNNTIGKIPGVPELDLPEISIMEPPQIPRIESPKEEESLPEKPVQGMVEGGIVNNYTTGDTVNNYTTIQNMSEGGPVTQSTGEKITGMGPDTQMVALQPGEVVMSKKAVDTYGADTLLGMNASAGGTNRPSMGKIQGFQGGGMVGLKPGAQYDIILPLDHVRPENSRRIPDRRGGNTYRNAAATGAAGRERHAQDPASRMIAQRLTQQGYRVKVVTPEQFGNYEDYDNFIRKQSNLGTRIAPLHFDAAEDPNTGKVVGTGFLTRTRRGDSDDATFAAPVQKVLADFQKENPDLGRISQDTQGNATVNVGAASPTALVELGMQTRWEKRYGKNFTEHPEFQKFAMNVADAIGEGSGITPQGQPQKGRQEPAVKPDIPPAPGMSQSQAYSQFENLKPGSGESVRVPNVGTIQRGRNFFGQPETKYFTPDGKQVDKKQFDSRFTSQPQQQKPQPSQQQKPQPQQQKVPGSRMSDDFSAPSPKGYESKLKPSGDSKSMYKKLGINENVWKTYKDTIASIEVQGMSLDKGYSIAGGSGGLYDGRYQMGKMAKADAAQMLGIPVPSRQEYRNNPQLQEDMFIAYTAANHKYLMAKSPEFRNATPLQRMQYLGYAHNQGWSKAAGWLETGVVSSTDGFGTKGTKFTDKLAKTLKPYTDRDVTPAESTEQKPQPAQTQQPQQQVQPQQQAVPGQPQMGPKPQREDFGQGRSGAKKYQEALKRYESGESSQPQVQPQQQIQPVQTQPSQQPQPGQSAPQTPLAPLSTQGPSADPSTWSSVNPQQNMLQPSDMVVDASDPGFGMVTPPSGPEPVVTAAAPEPVVTAAAPTPPPQQPSIKPGPISPPPKPPSKGGGGNGGISALPIPSGGGKTARPGAAGAPSAPAGFSPVDQSNPERLVVKAMYNIVG